jgi:ADP-ribose pyrophosphatase YjhB (NUDIX family)
MCLAISPSFSPGSPASSSTRWSSVTVAGTNLGIVIPILAVVGELAGWRFCPRCRNELRGDERRVECRECGFVAYASSKPTAGALVEDGDRVLLARRAKEPFKGRWDIPGGFLEVGEHPLDGLRRELREETGLDVEPLEFLGVWMDRYGGESTAEATLNFYWTARVAGGEAAPADDVDDLRWFSRDQLPGQDDLAFENVPLVLRAWQEHPERAALDR